VTHLHVLLQTLLGLPSPVYRHHRLLAGADGQRLAKRDGAKTLASLRAQGLSPADVRTLAGL
jgi:glutamyl-Q tRNA(Asp) synthetase